MSKFEWQTEDDWQDEIEQPAEATSTHHWRYLGLFILVAVVSFIVFTQLRETVDETTIQTETDVRATFELLHDSAENSDIELFSTYLSGRDREWTVGYQQLVGNGSLIEREALRLKLVSERPEIAEITLGADLRSAVLTATISYSIPVGNGLSQTVTLQQPYHFRQGETRWLFAPPEEGFWGEEQFGTGSRLLYMYPMRDERLVLRLMRDIDTALDSFCRREPTFDCFNKWQIYFVSQPLTLADLTGQPQQVEFRTLTVPTPTLIGLPDNEDSYRALRTGYAHLIFSTLFADEIRFICCEKEALFQALVDQISAELGLRANLDAPENFQLAQQHVAADNWPFDWDGTYEDKDISLKVNYTTVTFLRQEYRNVSAYEMLALLPRYADRASWLQQIIATIDLTANENDSQMILETNYTVYQNWLGQRLDSYATVTK